MKKIILLIIFIQLSLFIFSFDGLTDNKGSHINITKNSLTRLFGLKFGKIVKKDKNFIYGIVNFKIENPTIADIIAFSSRDIDLYYFGILPPHGQTERYDYKKEYKEEELKRIETEAIFKYLKFIAQYYNKIEDAYYNNDQIKGAFYIGFILHSIQDLFAHYGMTNEQHLYLTKIGKNPDYNAKSIAECEIKTDIFLVNIANILSEKAKINFLNSIKNNIVIKENINSLSKKILKKDKDIYWEGIKYILFTKYDSNCMKYFEKIKWDADRIFEIILDKNLMKEIENINDINSFSDFLKRIKYSFSKTTIL